MLSRQGHVFISRQGKNIIPTSSQQRKKEKKSSWFDVTKRWTYQKVVVAQYEVEFRIYICCLGLKSYGQKIQVKL